MEFVRSSFKLNFWKKEQISCKYCQKTSGGIKLFSDTRSAANGLITSNVLEAFSCSFCYKSEYNNFVVSNPKKHSDIFSSLCIFAKEIFKEHMFCLLNHRIFEYKIRRTRFSTEECYADSIRLVCQQCMQEIFELETGDYGEIDADGPISLAVMQYNETVDFSQVEFI